MNTNLGDLQLDTIPLFVNPYDINIIKSVVERLHVASFVLTCQSNSDGKQQCYTHYIADAEDNPRDMVAGHHFSFSGREVSVMLTHSPRFIFSLPHERPSAFPRHCADSMTAFIVILFVCPAAVCDIQARAKTTLVTPIPITRVR
jgi:hypothetical protein